MKKLIAFLSLGVFLTSCSLFNNVSGSVQNIDPNDAGSLAYYSVKLTESSFILADQTELMVDAAKNGKKDSAIIYAGYVNSLTDSVITFKDSVVKYTNRIRGK